MRRIARNSLFFVFLAGCASPVNYERPPVELPQAPYLLAGLLRARLLGVFTVADASGPEADSGEMMRYLAEAIWYPTALVPDEWLRWQAVDERSAIAVLTDGGQEVAVKFFFDDEGLVSHFEAERFRIEKGRCRKVPWRAYCSGYTVRGGFRVPREARVAWRLPEGELEYFRGRIENIEYDP